MPKVLENVQSPKARTPSHDSTLLQQSSRIFQKLFPSFTTTEAPRSRAVVDKNLEQALDNDDEPGVKLALSQGASLNTRGTMSGTTPLIFAIRHDFDIHDRIGPMIIRSSRNQDYPGSIDARDNTGRTALSYAVQKGDRDVVKMLIGNRAHVDQDLLHVLPDTTTTEDTLRIAEVLIRAGARVDARDDSGKTPLIAVCAKTMFFGEKDAELVRVYLEYDVDSRTQKDKFGQTALSWAVRPRYMPCSPFAAAAARKWQREIIDLLLDAPGGMASVNECDATRLGRTPLMHAVDAGTVGLYDPLERGVDCQCEIISLLLDRGADVDAQDKEGWSALWVAVLADSPRLGVARLLLDRQANPGVKDSSGRTLRSRAIGKHGRDDARVVVVRLLLEYGGARIAPGSEEERLPQNLHRELEEGSSQSASGMQKQRMG